MNKVTLPISRNPVFFYNLGAKIARRPLPKAEKRGLVYLKEVKPKLYGKAVANAWYDIVCIKIIHYSVIQTKYLLQNEKDA